MWLELWHTVQFTSNRKYYSAYIMYILGMSDAFSHRVDHFEPMFTMSYFNVYSKYFTLNSNRENKMEIDVKIVNGFIY